MSQALLSRCRLSYWYSHAMAVLAAARRPGPAWPTPPGTRAAVA